MAFKSFGDVLKHWDWMILKRDIKPVLKTYASKQGKALETYSRGNFARQGFDGRKWVARKVSSRLYLRNAKSRKGGSRNTNPLLYRSGNLKRSVRSQVTGLTITTRSDLPYADIQNSGGLAGRSRIPSRPFLGNSEDFKRGLINDFYTVMERFFK